MKEKQYISKERYEQLKQELEDLKTKKRQEIAERLRQAKEFGDLSENAEYSEARDEQSRVEQRIFDLDEFLKNAVVLTKKSFPKETIDIGSRVVVKKNGKEMTYEIVGSDEADPQGGKISNESPLGRAFLQHKAGDVINVDTPSGKISYEITKVE
jgi:transcription elongation factor GreA